jgi:hypothetical protein
MAVESAATLTSICGKAEGFARRIALLEGKLTEAHHAHDTAKVPADADLRWEEA